MAKDIKYDILFLAYNPENNIFGITANDDASAKNVDLRKLTVKNPLQANQEAYDAFVGILKNEGIGENKNVSLKRPFAQVNAVATHQDLVDNAYTKLGIEVKHSSLKIYGAPTTYNVFAETTSGTADLEYQTAPVMTEYNVSNYPNQVVFDATNKQYYLATAYVLAGADANSDAENLEAEFKFYRGETVAAAESVSTLPIPQLPLQRNYRTNVIGDLLTKTESYTITIEKGFGGDHIVNEFNATSTSINDLLQNNKNETEALSYNVENTENQNSVSITIPDDTKAASLSFTLKNLSDNEAVTITNESNDTDSYEGPVVVEVPEGVNLNNLEINLPSAHVTIKQGAFKNVIASTSGTTLIIPKGVTINNLEIKEGNAEIYYGAVTETIVKQNDTKITWLVDTKEQLKNIATQVNEGTSFKGQTIKLTADIDLNNEEWTPIGNSGKKFQGIFDGNGYTISNLVITGNKSDVGLFGFTTDGEIKNLTVKNANVSGYLDVAVVAGTPHTSKYTNVKVIGHVEVNGFAYVGTVGGKNAYADWENITVDVDETSYVNANSVDNGTAYRTYVGGVIGFMGEGKHKVSNVTSNINVTGSTIDVGGIVGIAHYGNTFENVTCTGNVEITNAAEAGDAEEIGGIAGVWHNQNDTKVTFNNCSFTGTLKTNIEGVDYYYDGLVGKPYSSTGTGKLIINGVETIDGVKVEGDVYSISNARGMFWFANEVNVNKNAFNGKTVELAANIDLKNQAWNPIGQTGVATFNGVFDGQNHTISNLDVDSDEQTGEYYSSGLFGWVESHTAGHGHIKNVKIDGATIKGHHNCGALVGYITQETALVENCHVKNATITCTYANSKADGDKAGALIGNATVATPVKNCTASQSTVSAGRDAGQVIGAAKEANVTSCTATEVTVSHTQEENTTGDNIRNEVIGRLL